MEEGRGWRMSYLILASPSFAYRAAVIVEKYASRESEGSKRANPNLPSPNSGGRYPD